MDRFHCSQYLCLTLPIRDKIEKGPPHERQKVERHRGYHQGLTPNRIEAKAVNHIWYTEGGVMEVTEVKIFPVQEERLKAYATITFDHCFVIRDLKVISGNNGLFVAMPSKKRKDGTYRDTAHPLNNQTRQMIESKVLDEYNKEIQKNK
jgi:stage V sporulation protein G